MSNLKSFYSKVVRMGSENISKFFLSPSYVQVSPRDSLTDAWLRRPINRYVYPPHTIALDGKSYCSNTNCDRRFQCEGNNVSSCKRTAGGALAGRSS